MGRTKDTYRNRLITWFNSNAFNGIQISSIKDLWDELVKNESTCSIIKYILMMSADGYCFEYEEDIKSHGLGSIKDIDKYLEKWRS